MPQESDRLKGPFAWEYLIAQSASHSSSPASDGEAAGQVCSGIYPGSWNWMDLAVPSVTRQLREAFNISSAEMEAVGEGRIEDLVIERVALVDTYR